MRIAVAMSGGVDSSVVAKMLKDEGHELVGLFLKLWNDPTSPVGLRGTSPICNVAKENRCCNYEALEDARKVAHGLDIPFYVINAVDEFKKEVVDYFVDEYKKLNTPNPCIVCNEKIKFDLLLKKALSIGCEKLATGHYARIVDSGNSKLETLNPKQIPNSKSEITNKNCHSEFISESRDSRRVASQTSALPQNNGTEYHLLAGVDTTKDQSYMLYRLNQNQLSKTLFPLGEMTKKDVRALAVKWDLPVKEKPESQEICFFGDRDYRSFLKRYLPDKYFKPGEIVDKKGNILGKHEGLINYTIGQRKGVDQSLSAVIPTEAEGSLYQKEIATPPIKRMARNDNISKGQKEEVDLKPQTSDLKPLYVIGFDVEKNRLIVGADEDIYRKEMIVSDLNWINPSENCHPELTQQSHPELAEVYGVTLRGSALVSESLKVKIRYRHAAVPCKMVCHPERREGSRDSHRVTSQTSVLPQNDNIEVTFDEPQRAITPGQSAVFYLGEEVIGGGYIK